MTAPNRRIDPNHLSDKAHRKGTTMPKRKNGSIRKKSVIGALCAGMLVGATSVASPASAAVPNTLVNALSNFKILEVPPAGSTGRLYVGGALFQTLLPPIQEIIV